MENQYSNLWFMLAVANGFMAKYKNDSSGGYGFGGFAWFLISLIFGPLATLYIILFK